MRATESQTKRWVARAGVTALLAALTVLGVAQPAAAHGQLAYSDPAKDSTVSQPLDRISLYFTEKPPGDAFFLVSAPDGARVDNGWQGGEPKRLDEPVQELNLVDGKWEPMIYNTGFPAVINVAHWPATGAYTVRYLSIASDGDKVQGEVRINYTGPVTPPPAGWTVPVNQPAARLAGGNSDASGSPDPQAAQPSSVAAPAEDSGAGWGVWLVPGIIVLIATALIVNAVRKSRDSVNTRIRTDARRKPAGAGASTSRPGRPSGGKNGSRPGQKAARSGPKR
jgi:methionine-rich copper-binding protein CopC